TQASNKLSGGQIAGAAVMGALSALIVSPCVTAPLAGALAYIAQTGNAATGGTALFALSMGMGVPLILVGVGAGNLLPRSGHWLTV
ncbi:cytochrome c biogenesis protein CcdA, partial [Acinetobacter baumannii]